MMAKKKLIPIIVAAVLLVAILVAVGVLIYLNTPKNVAARAVTGVLEDVGEREEIRPLLNMFTEGSLKVSVEKLTEEREIGKDSDLLGGMTASGRIYFSADKNAIMLKDLQVQEGSKSLLTGDAYVSDSLIYVKENEILDGAYGIKLSNLREQLEKSIFAPRAKTSYSLDEDVYNTLLEVCDVLEDLDLEELSEDAIDLLEDVIEDIYNIVMDHVEIDSDTKEVRFDGIKKKVRVLTISLSEDEIPSMCIDILDYLLDDKQVPKFIKKYYKYTGIDDSNGDNDIWDDLIGSDAMWNSADDLVEGYKDLLKEALEYLEKREDGYGDNDWFDEYDSTEYCVEIVTPRLTSDLLRLTVYTKTGGSSLFGGSSSSKSELICLDFGGTGLADSEHIQLTVAGDDEPYFEYEISTDSSEKFESELRIEGNTCISMSINRKKNSFAFSYYPKKREQIVISGTLNSSGDQTSIVIKEIEFKEASPMLGGGVTWDTTATYDAKIELVIYEDSKMPSAPKDYENFLSISEKQINKWASNIRNIFEDPED